MWREQKPEMGTGRNPGRTSGQKIGRNTRKTAERGTDKQLAVLVISLALKVSPVVLIIQALVLTAIGVFGLTRPAPPA